MDEKLSAEEQALVDELQGRTERTTRARIAAYWGLRQDGYSHEESLEAAKQILHVG